MARDTEWHFGPFRVEEGNERLWRGTELIRLRPKSFAVLCYLLARAGRLVTKAELLQTVWPEVVVSEAMLTICISELRRALGETRQAPACIEMVPRRAVSRPPRRRRGLPAGASGAGAAVSRAGGRVTGGATGAARSHLAHADAGTSQYGRPRGAATPRPWCHTGTHAAGAGGRGGRADGRPAAGARAGGSALERYGDPGPGLVPGATA